MLVADVHPGIEELAAFSLGRLAGATLAAIETHVAACTSCQERAAAAPGDPFVELLRSAHHRQDDTATAAQAHEPTPRPAAAIRETVTDARNRVSDAATESVSALAPDTVPPELAGHDRYRVKRLLGMGGMGAVYLAEHRVMQRSVALKVIDRRCIGDPAALERFRREVRAAARLSHPNIVATFDAEDAGGVQFLAMEYVEGVSLSRLVKENGPLPVARACAYIRQAALGLQHAHERGMVHRDVKPDNLMLVRALESGVRSQESGEPGQATASAREKTSALTPDPRLLTPVVKVLDFGLAVLTAERGGHLTDANVIMGTAAFMAPEQADDPRAADIRADVYSLGCTLYFLLTGTVPFPAPTSLAQILAHHEKPLPSIRQARPEVPAELARILERMCAKKPDDRYQTPGDVAAALAPFANQKPGFSKKPGFWRRPVLARTLAAALLAGVVLASGVGYRIQTDKGELVITTLNEDVEVVIKQGGKQVDVIDTKTKKSIRLWSGAYDLELKDAPEGLRLDITNVTLMRDKTELAKIERVAKVAAPADASAAQIIQPLHRIPFTGGDRFCCLDVAQDGRSFLAGRNNMEKIRVWDMATGKLTRELSGWVARITPDGGHLIVNGSHQFEVQDLPTGKIVQRFGSTANSWNFSLSTDGTKFVNCTRTHNEIYDWATGKQLCRIPWSGSPRAVLTPDGRHLLTQSNGKPPLRVFDNESGKEVDAFRQLRDVPPLMAMSAEGNRLLCHDNRHWRIFDIFTGKQLADIEAGAEGTLNGNGRLLVATTDRRDDYGVWDVASGLLLARLQFPAPVDGTYDLRVSRDGRFAVFAGPGDIVFVFRLPEPTPEKLRLQGDQAKVGEIRRLPWEGGDIRSNVVSADSQYHIAAGPNRDAHLWDLKTGEPLCVFPGGIAFFTPDSKQVLAGGWSDRQSFFGLYDVATGKEIRNFSGPGNLWNFRVSPDGKRAVSIADMKTINIHIWDLATGKEVHKFTGARSMPRFLFSSNGKRFLYSFGDKPFRVVDLETGLEVRAYENILDKKRLSRFLSDDREVMGYRETTLQFYEVATGKLLRELDLGKGADFILESLSQDGRRFVSVHPDGACRLWDVMTGEVLHRFAIDGKNPQAAAISPDGRYATASDSGAVYLWRLPDPPLAAAAKP